MRRDETHPDETELLDFVASGRLPFVREAATHAGRCALCATSVADLMRIAQAMFELEPEVAVSSAARLRAALAARDLEGGRRSGAKSGRVRPRKSRPGRGRASSAGRGGSG
jgi:hypothetical protein